MKGMLRRVVRGDQILFSNPDQNGNGQVCVIDLHQVWKDW